jgi:hypothetical protein
MDSFLQESFVDSGLLSVLSVSLGNQEKCDILYSLLASRVMATSRFPGISTFSQWHSTFVLAFERSGWTLRREQDLQPLSDDQSTVTLHNVFTRAMAGESLRDQRELTLEALNAFTHLPTDSPSVVRFRERYVSQRAVKLPGGDEEQRFTVHLLLAVSTRKACVDLFHLEFETTQGVEELFLQQTFLTRSFTSPVLVKHHVFEMAARAFTRSRDQIVAFVQGYQLMAIRPGIELPLENVTCGAVMAPDIPSPR